MKAEGVGVKGHSVGGGNQLIQSEIKLQRGWRRAGGMGGGVWLARGREEVEEERRGGRRCTVGLRQRGGVGGRESGDVRGEDVRGWEVQGTIGPDSLQYCMT